jgi:hypothetical protein
MRRIGQHLSYANVMSTIAVFAVLAGGGAWAAATIGTSDIKDGAVTAKKLHAKAVTNRKINGGAVGPGKLAESAKALFLGSAVTVRHSATEVVNNNSISGPTAQCNPGEIAVGGGVGWSTTPQANTMVMLESGPVDSEPPGWTTTVGNTSGSDQSFTVNAVCVAVG